MAHRLLILACSILASAAAVSAQGEGAKWDAEEALARIRLVCLGDYMIKKGGHPAVSPADVGICQRALEDEDDELVIAGCRGMAALARRDFFGKTGRQKLDHIVDLLIRRLRDENGKVAHAAIQALTAFDTPGGSFLRQQYTRPSPKKPSPHGSRATPRIPLLTPEQCRRIVSQCLAMVTRKDPETQWRAGGMLRSLVDDVGPQVHVEIARTLLGAIARLSKRELEDAKKEERALDSLKSALAVVPAPDAAVGSEMATLFLADAKRLGADHWSYYSAANCLRALSKCVGVLAGGQRAAVVDHLCAAARDHDLFFMTTSGRRSPFHHHGVMAVMQMVPVLASDELTRAEGAVRALREEFEAVVAKERGRVAFKQRDLDSVFGGTDEIFAARRKQLAGAKKE